jgi:hypothetical protein
MASLVLIFPPATPANHTNKTQKIEISQMTLCPVDDGAREREKPLDEILIIGMGICTKMRNCASYPLKVNRLCTVIRIRNLFSNRSEDRGYFVLVK